MYTLPSNAIAGSISFDQYLDIAKDIVVSFDYACYGPNINGSEGFCVYFGDTLNPIVQGGGPGPGLAYSSVYNIDPSAVTPYPPSLSGITCGILGVGFDITGNFGNNNYFSSGYNDIVPNSIALRSTYNSDFNIITRTTGLNTLTSFTNPISLYQQITGSESPVFNRVRVRLTDFGQRIVVDIKPVNSLNFTNYLDYSFADYNNSLLSDPVLSGTPLVFTPTVLSGLGFATGEDTSTIFKIRNFNVNGAFTLSAIQAEYTYDIDTKTLSATESYSNPAIPFFFTGDTFAIVNNYAGHVTTNPVVTGSSLITGDPTGAPYIAGDNYVKVTQHN